MISKEEVKHFNKRENEGGTAPMPMIIKITQNVTPLDHVDYPKEKNVKRLKTSQI